MRLCRAGSRISKLVGMQAQLGVVGRCLQGLHGNDRAGKILTGGRRDGIFVSPSELTPITLCSV